MENTNTPNADYPTIERAIQIRQEQLTRPKLGEDTVKRLKEDLFTLERAYHVITGRYYNPPTQL